MRGYADFAERLLLPDGGLPAGLIRPDAAPAPKRYAVYKNNVAVSLTEALETGFPVIAQLVGTEFFQAMAGVYLRAHPPTSPVMTRYGATFPTFLEGFGPAQSLPYLADVARLEFALRESYHAADHVPLAATALGEIAPEALMTAGITLAPSLRMLRSRWPVHGIWCANTQEDAAEPIDRAEAVLILRPAYDPVPHLLPPGGATFLGALTAGASFGAALTKATEAVADFDLSPVLSLLIEGQAIAEIKEDQDVDID